jgi:hypothetical protein
LSPLSAPLTLSPYLAFPSLSLCSGPLQNLLPKFLLRANISD